MGRGTTKLRFRFETARDVDWVMTRFKSSVLCLETASDMPARTFETVLCQENDHFPWLAWENDKPLRKVISFSESCKENDIIFLMGSGK